MVKAAKETFKKIKIVDDNHADALWLLAMAVEEYGCIGNDNGEKAHICPLRCGEEV